MFGLRRVHRNGHIADCCFTFGLALRSKGRADELGSCCPVPYRVPELLDFPLFRVYGTQSRLPRFMLCDIGG